MLSRLPHYVMVWLFHLVVVVPLLLYMWYTSQIQHKQIPDVVWNIVLLFALSALAYHGYKLLQWISLNLIKSN